MVNYNLDSKLDQRIYDTSKLRMVSKKNHSNNLECKDSVS